MNCKDKGYEVGQVFEVIGADDEESFAIGSTVALSRDDGSSCPKFDLISGKCNYRAGLKTQKGAYLDLDCVTRIYPPEEKKTTVQLNDEYSAEILEDGDIKVGCQTFTFDKLEELYNAAKEKQ